MDVKTYRVRYRCQETEFEIEGDRSFVEEHAQTLLEQLKRSSPLVVEACAPRERRSLALPPAMHSEVINSFQEMLQNQRLSGGPDIALAVAYCMQKKADQHEFATRDLSLILDQVPSVAVGNLSLAVRRAVDRGYLLEHKSREGKRSSYSLTPLGTQRVEQKLS